MKKLFLFLSLLFISMSFANSIKSTKLENISLKNEVISERIKPQNNEEDLELPPFYCYTRTSYWYTGTTCGMGGCYDSYEVVVTTVCYN